MKMSPPTHPIIHILIYLHKSIKKCCFQLKNQSNKASAKAMQS